MGGANYMGGKRNAMKARARDQVSRKQKGFFKRQRLDMLAKGLSGSLEPMQSHHLATKVGPGDIELAHARTRQETFQGERSGAGGFIPSPVHISSTRSRSRKRRRIGDAHTSGSDVGFKSEILDKLDQCEPLFLRKVMDQILATPDLASLSHKSPVVSACQDQSRKTITQTRRSVTRSKVGSTIGTVTVDANETMPKKKSDATRNSRVNAIEMDDISDWDSEYNIHDSGYEDNFGERIASNSDWSTYQYEGSCSSAPCHNDGGHGCEKAGEYETGGITDFPVFEEQGLHVKATKKSVFIREDGETIYGRLFEDPDPWRRIGIILGLEKEEEVRRAPVDDNNIEFETPNLEPKKVETRRNNDPIDENTATPSVVPENEQGDCVSDISQEVVNAGSAQSCSNKSMSLANTFLEVFNDEYAEPETHREGSQEVLAMPQLEEINGKFLAPSISLDVLEWEE